MRGIGAFCSFGLRVSYEGRVDSALGVGPCALRPNWYSSHMQRIGAVCSFGLRVSNQGRADSPLEVGLCALCGQTAKVLTCRESGRLACSCYELVTRAEWTVRWVWAPAHSVPNQYSPHMPRIGAVCSFGFRVSNRGRGESPLGLVSSLFVAKPL